MQDVTEERGLEWIINPDDFHMVPKPTQAPPDGASSSEECPECGSDECSCYRAGKHEGAGFVHPNRDMIALHALKVNVIALEVKVDHVSTKLDRLAEAVLKRKRGGFGAFADACIARTRGDPRGITPPWNPNQCYSCFHRRDDVGKPAVADFCAYHVGCGWTKVPRNNDPDCPVW